MDQVLICGGGIGGLTAAAALQQEGIPVRVFEQAPELREVGAGVSLWPNAMRALSLLGLFRAVLGEHVPIERILVQRRDGRVLLRLTDAGGYQEPGICVHRAYLQRVLAERVPPDRLNLGRRLVDFQSDGASVTAVFQDGSRARGPLLIGSDGIHSIVRARLHGAAPARYRGYEIWRAMSEFDLPHHLLGQSTEWWGPGRRFGVLPGEPGRVFWYATHTTASGATSDDGIHDYGEDRARLRTLFADWPPVVRQLIDAPGGSDLVRTRAHDRWVPPTWGAGPVTLLGDAAHAMTPNMGQGACTAIEDAVVLARCLARHGLTSEALRRYEEARAPRTRWMVRQSRRIGRLGQLTNPLLVAIRDALMRRIPEWLTGPVERRAYAFQVDEGAGGRRISGR